MRHVSGAVLGAALCVGATAAEAAPAGALLTMEYSIGALSRALQFMGDGSVRIACDGSVLVACDGSVTPVPNASFRTLGDGSVRELTPIALLGDGSVRTLGDGSVLPATDVIAVNSLTFVPNPFLAATLGVLDFGTPTSFIATFGGPLLLGANDFTYDLTGSATLTDGGRDGVSMGAVSALGLSGLVFGAVDGAGLAALGAGGLSGAGAAVLAPAAGAGSCVGCATQALAIGFQGSGDGDQYAVNARLDLTAVPAPGSLGLLAAGLFGLAALRRRA